MVLRGGAGQLKRRPNGGRGWCRYFRRRGSGSFYRGGRARLRTHEYPLPGDKFPAYELNLFDVASGKQIKPAVERVDFGVPRPRWHGDGQRLTYEKTDRGHQRFRVIEVEARTGARTREWPAHRDLATTLDLDPGSGRLASGGLDGEIRIWQTDYEPAPPTSSADLTRITQALIDQAGLVEGHFEATGIRPKFLTHAASHGIQLPAELFRPDNQLA